MDEETTVTAPPEGRPAASRGSGWDFTLMLATTALLAALGVQSLGGTLYAWWAARTIEGWAQSPAYASYVEAMNAVAAPLLVALFVVMGLCVPKRLFSRRVLAGVSAAMVALGLASWAVTGTAATGLSTYLAGAAAIQVAVVMMTVAGVPSLAYLTEGRVTKAGSGLLHLGFIVFAYVVVALQHSAAMLAVFWIAAALCLGGTALSFYAGAVARALTRGETDAA